MSEQQQKPFHCEETSKNLSPAKRLVFSVLLLLVPLILLAALEGIVRLTFDHRDDPFLNIGMAPSFFEKKMIGGEPFWIVSHDEAYPERGMKFRAHKKPGTIRIFCLGGSASAGWPHPPGEIYSKYLEESLQRAFPKQPIEVLNVSAHAYPSYRVRMIFDQVMQFQPDLVIIYSGNNEFLEPRSYSSWSGYLQRPLDFVNHLAIARLMQYLINHIQSPESFLAGQQRQNVSFEIYSKVARQALQLRQDPEQLEFVKQHYAYNIGAMVDAATQQGIPAILATVPVNLRDWRPNVSYNSLTGSDYKAWQEKFAAGRAALLRGDSNGAVESFQKAIAMEPLHAESHYLLGKALELAGNHDLAFKSYLEAKEKDYNPFRALASFNESVREIASSQPSVHLVDLEEEFARASAPHAPDFGLFLDYVHPSKRGNLLIAEQMFDTVVKSGVLGSPPETVSFTYVPKFYSAMKLPYDEEKDETLQNHLMFLFGMMHQHEAMLSLAQRQRDLRGEANLPPRFQRALRTFPAYLNMERSTLLGDQPSAAERAMVTEKLREFYQYEYHLSRERALEIFL